jgi:hypothetical protein
MGQKSEALTRSCVNRFASNFNTMSTNVVKLCGKNCRSIGLPGTNWQSKIKKFENAFFTNRDVRIPPRWFCEL